MSIEEIQLAKDLAHDELFEALQTYFKITETQGSDEAEQAAELEDMLLEIGKAWDVII